MKKRIAKIVLGLLAAGFLATYPAVDTYAGTITVMGDKDTAVVGDTYTVTVDVADDEGAAQAPEISVNYDVARLNFESCSAEYGGGAGGLVTLSNGTSQLTFTILSGGQADVDVTAIFDGDGANPQTAKASVMVDGEDIAAASQGAMEISETGVEAGSITSADGTKIVSTVFASEFMPVGFSKTTVSYEEQMVEAAKFDMGDIVLLYVTDADGNNGNFDVYNQATGELTDFLQISGIENRFIIALSAGEDVKVPEGFAKASLQWNAQNLEAYSYMGEMASDAPIPASDFFLIYAISSEGNKGFYMYDQNEGTYQRFVEGLHSGKAEVSAESLISQIASPVVKEEGEEKGGINILFVIAVSLAVLLVALIVAVIIMAVKLKEFNSYEYIDEDEDEFGSFPQRMMQEQLKPSDVSEPVVEKQPQKEEPVVKDEEKPEIPNDFVIRKKQQSEQEAYERDVLASEDKYIEDSDSISDNDDIFSPRARDERPSRSDKKAMKQQEKARKKAEKQMKKEFGEFGPVDWQSWQDAVEGGDKTAAMAAKNGSAISETAEEPKMSERRPAPERQENPERRPAPERQERPAKPPVPEVQEKPANPMDMMKNIPANDNKAPVQAKPVQQFDFDDDFEFEFLDLDDDD